jgi:hypothetical protein
MTTLLNQALNEVQKLSADQQDSIATLILEELADTARWDNAFTQSQDVLSRIAAKVRAEKRAGRVYPKGFDEL